MSNAKQSSSDTIELLCSHRSIRRFSHQSVDPKDLQTIVLAGQAASTSSFGQSVSLIRVSDNRLRAKLAHWAGDQAYVESAPEFLVFCADLHRAHQLVKALKQGSEEADSRFDWTEQFITASIDASLFAQNCAIAAQSLGLGICYIGGIRNQIQAVADALELPQLVVPLFGMCLGYPDQTPEQKPRLPIQSVLFENRYAEPTAYAEALLAYDAHIKEYYERRTRGKLSQTWSEQLDKQTRTQSRPHMREFLLNKGFARR